MNDRERGGGGLGAFVLGIVVGAAAGFLLAPAAGGETRRRLARKLEDLRDVAAGEAKELGALIAGEADDEAPRSDREELQERLQEARRRRRPAGAPRRASPTEEDEPVA